MATSSNSVSIDAGAAVQTGGAPGGVTGGGNANVSFDGPAPVERVEAPVETPAVENIVTQGLEGSSLVRQPSTQPVQREQVQTRQTETANHQPAQAMSTGVSNAPTPTGRPVVSAIVDSVGPLAQQPSGGVGSPAPTAGPTMSSNNLGENQPVNPPTQQRSRSQYPNAPTKPAEQQQPVRSNQKYQGRQQMFAEMIGREEIRREGVVEKPAPINKVSRANRRFKKSKEMIQKKIKTVLHGRSYSGTSFYETIFSKPDLMPNCVSIGSENLIDSLREPNSTLLQLVNDRRANLELEALDAEFCLNNISVLVDAINDLNIEVTLEKTPVNVKNSIQVRTLRAHYGRGIGLHPTQTKAYNADYDGDPAVINLDQENIKHYSRAMTQLVDIEGNATIDPDFFPLDPIDDSQRGNIKKELVYRNTIWLSNRMNKVFDAYVNACNKGDWVGLMQAIDDAAPTSNDVEREQFISETLKTLYDFSTERRGLSLRTQFEEMVEHSNYNPPKANLDPFVYNLVDLVDEIVAGRPAPNFQDFTRFYNKFYGDVRGKKNVPFRLLADFAKAINRTDLITVGSDIFDIKPIRTDASGIAQDARIDMDAEVTINQLWQFTCAAGVSKQISGRMHMGSRQLAVSTQVKSMVSRECPLPNYDFNNPNISVEQQFRNWIHSFVDSYNRNMRMLEISQISFRQGMTPVRNEAKFAGIDENSFDGLAKALVEVFGDKTVERVFPGTILERGRRKPNGELMKEQTSDGIVYSYRNMSISNFSINNRISFKSEHGRNESIPRKDIIARNIANDQFTPMDVLLLVADRRTSQLGDYNKAWLEATKENQNRLSAIQDSLLNNDYNEYAMNMLEFMHLMSPNMFDYFGMDSPTTFVNSKWGKKLIAAKSLSEFRSHLISMTIEYRLNKSNKILQEMDSITSDSVADIDRLEALDSAFELEMDSLASSSMVWDTIAKESMEGNRTFLAIINDGGVKNWDSRAASFWKSEDAKKYHTLITFLKSSEPYETKIAVLADVTRVRQRYADITVDEIMGQLAYHPDRLHAGPRFDMESGIRSEIDTMKESVNRISSYQEKSIDNVKEESEALLEEARKNKAAFEARLRRFSDDPGYMVHVDTILAADAIASIYDKTYDDSEKIKQQAVVNGYFGAVSLQRSGGYYTHLQQTDNAVVNMVGFDQLNVLDIVRVLGNPDIEIHVYDEFGLPAARSRETLCGGNTIDDVLRYLENNPRISLACRRFVAGVSSDVNGTARMTAINDLEAGDTDTTRVFSLLNDRPRFLAIAALCTPANNNVGRNLAEDIHDNLDNLCNFIGREVIDGKGMQEIIQDAERVLGINPDTILEIRSRGGFDETASDLDYDAVANMYSEVIGEILDCVEIVSNANVELRPSEIPPVENMGVDESSIISYYDARQQLSGARTSTMIGIEGAETKKNLVLKEYLRNRPDTYMMSEDGRTVIPVTEGTQTTDLTLERNPRRQTGSISKSLEVKREKGAETFNAKSKKYGDDGTNSIIKFIRMGTRSMFERFGKKREDTWSIEDGQDLLDRIAKCESKAEAVPILAQALIDADARLGYTDEVEFVESDYWNRADLMLAESVDADGNVTLVVRTLEQLSVAMRNRLSDEAIESEDSATVLDELQQIVDTLGTASDPLASSEADVAHRCMYNVSIHSSIGNRFRVDRALRQRSSSTERNYALMYKIFNQWSKDYSPSNSSIGPKRSLPSRSSINDYSKRMLSKLKGKTKSAIKNLANPEFEKGSYDYMGSVSDSETQIIPGPQSLILFDVPPSDGRSKDLINKCYTYGITAAFESIDNVPADYLDDVIWTGELYILPFFDMRLNGSLSKPIMPAPSQFPFNPDNIMTNVEDTTYEFREGDATYHMTQELAGRVRVNFRGDDQVFDVYRLFPNVLRSYPDSDFQMDFCTNEEIQKYIINGEFDAQSMTVNGFDRATIDIGVIPENENYAREAERFNIRLREYQDHFGSSDADGFLTDDVRYDSIVGFVKIVIDGNMVALAPIWPFHLEESGSVPTTFQVDKIEFDPDSHSFNLSWRYSGGLEGQYIKAFEGIGASNKMIASSDYARSRSLENGLAVDGFYSTKSVASRLFASNKRIHTMISLMMIPRVDKNYSYNFAELSGSFPDDPKLPDGRSVKDALLAGDMNITDWIAVRDSIKQFHVDPEIDSLVRFWVDKCIEFGTVNPTILLATKTNNGVMWPMATEFECFMDTSLNFQNAFMKFMNAMQPTLCPPSIDADSRATLFKPVVNNTSEDYGVLQMLVPHYDENGEEYKVPENVYLSFGFFGDEFSGFKKVNFNAFNRNVDSLNVSNNMNGFDLSQMMAFGRAGMSSVKMSASTVEAVPDAIMQKANSNNVPTYGGD